MKKLFTLLLMLSFCLNSFGHVSKKNRKLLDEWIGKTSHELIMNSGPAVRTASDENGGKILIYCSERYFDGTTYYRYLMFYVDVRGVIYSWRTTTGLIPPQYVVVR